MTSINSDFMSQLALRSLGKSSNMMTQAMERLSTGKRINSASDDAAGLGIATKLKAQVSSLNAASRNTSDALALIGTIDGQNRPKTTSNPKKRDDIILTDKLETTRQRIPTQDD